MALRKKNKITFTSAAASLGGVELPIGVRQPSVAQSEGVDGARAAQGAGARVAGGDRQPILQSGGVEHGEPLGKRHHHRALVRQDVDDRVLEFYALHLNTN